MKTQEETMLAFSSTKIVAKKLTELGFDVLKINKPTANGTDLQAVKSGKCYNFEVKQASRQTRSWRVGKTFSTKDDYIAIVFPNGSVHFEPMAEHASKLNKSGFRQITELARIYV